MSDELLQHEQTKYDQLERERNKLRAKVERQAALLHRWNIAASQYGRIAGSEYINDPERSMEAIRDGGEFRTSLEVRRATVQIRRDSLIEAGKVADRKAKFFRDRHDGIYDLIAAHFEDMAYELRRLAGDPQ